MRVAMDRSAGGGRGGVRAGIAGARGVRMTEAQTRADRWRCPVPLMRVDSNVADCIAASAVLARWPRDTFVVIDPAQDTAMPYPIRR